MTAAKIVEIDLPNRIRGLLVVAHAKTYILVNSAIEDHAERGRVVSQAQEKIKDAKTPFSFCAIM